jgi:hypothetical protein
MFGAALGLTARLVALPIAVLYACQRVCLRFRRWRGTGPGVNVKTHQIRLNFGLTRFLAWENRLYIQHGISVNNPAINYFLPLQAGYKTQFRVHSQFVFTF